jgi:hypothetical protein
MPQGKTTKTVVTQEQVKSFVSDLTSRKETPEGIAAFEVMLQAAQEAADQIED